MRKRRVEVTPMVAADLEQVLEIEADAFRSSWPRQVFLEELAREWARLEVVRERGDDGVSRVVAYCNYWVVRDEIHLLNIATHPRHRRAGHARVLMDHMIAFARRNDSYIVTLEVRRSNQAAIELYESYAFVAVGVRPRYYVEDREDALVMTLQLRELRELE